MHKREIRASPRKQADFLDEDALGIACREGETVGTCERPTPHKEHPY